MTLFAAAGWFMRRREMAAAWMALAGFAWLVASLQFLPFASPARNSYLHVTIQIVSATGLLLIPAYAGVVQAFFNVRRVFLWGLGALAGVVATGLAGLALGGIETAELASRAALCLASLGFVIVVLRETIRRPLVENGLVCVSAVLAGLAIAADFAAAGKAWPLPDVRLMPYAAVGSVAMLGLAVMRRMMAAVAAQENQNLVLEQRIERTKANLIVSEHARRSLEVANAVTRERERIMREIHDGIGSSLVAALASAERQGKQSTTAVVALKSALTDLRIAVDSLQPVEGNVATLLASLRYRLEPELRKSGIAIDWMVNDVPELDWLDAPNALHILRIFQEAFGNALGHSNATRIRVGCRLDIDDGRPGVSIEVADNGVGFDLASPSRGRGRANMKERAEALAGKLTISSAAGAGSAVVLWLPLLRPKLPS
jgi:signal transduction histidine kinase